MELIKTNNLFFNVHKNNKSEKNDVPKLFFANDR